MQVIFSMKQNLRMCMLQVTWRLVERFTCCRFQFSLPTPRGGKHSHNPILCEDQPEPQQRPRRKDKYHVLDPNVNAAVSPFESIDTASRAALCGVRDHKHAYRNRRNPNESKKRTGRKK